ncbi:MAG: hypothetical protein HY287_14070 [Planctomycetes bacterium]|nr:hypothetical protein [Planctomycetota bacterium]
MTASHVSVRIVGRFLLVSALVSSVLVTSAVGEGLVLHQHGVRAAHLHSLAFGDLQSGAAWSAKFGHPTSSKPTIESEPKNARVLAIVTTCMIFATSPRGTDAVDVHWFSHPTNPILVAAEPHQPPMDASFSVPLASSGETVSAVARLRNHTFLI